MHQAVLLDETLEALAIKPDGIYVDATFGRGGHAQAILERLSQGTLVVIDQDAQAIEVAHQLQDRYPTQMIVVHTNFENLGEVLKTHQISQVDGILFDLGVSSPQFDNPTRGFSYRHDERLDMRMDQSQSLDAYQVINSYSFEALKRIFLVYGEEPYAKQIARKIEAQRLIQPIETTLQLVDVIKSALPSKVLKAKGHPAKQVFMALRIEVNRELDVIKSVIDTAIQALAPEGRCAIITFHSLEDRIVKQTFQKYCENPIPSKLPIISDHQAAFRLYRKKPITASARELKENSRSHSAKLRVLIKN